MENKLTAVELRIGNRVKRGNDIAEVNLISEKEFGLKNINSMYPITIYELEPIPLTEEWYLKLGFDFKLLHGTIKIYSLNSFQYRNSKYSRGLTHRKLGSLKNSIKYVHQLQNLYFVLTNEELTIK